MIMISVSLFRQILGLGKIISPLGIRSICKNPLSCLSFPYRSLQVTRSALISRHKGFVRRTERAQLFVSSIVVPNISPASYGSFALDFISVLVSSLPPLSPLLPSSSSSAVSASTTSSSSSVASSKSTSRTSSSLGLLLFL